MSLNVILIIFIAAFIISCETKERFYRPDLPEKLCTIGIIDIDDTASSTNYNPLVNTTSLRHFSFERSVQSEYPEAADNLLREFELTISSTVRELFRYTCDSSEKYIIDLRIPDTILFTPGEKYNLRANAENLPEITSEIIAAESPATPELISIIKGDAVQINHDNGCTFDGHARYITITFSFEKDQNLYYGLMVEGKGFSFADSFVPTPGFINFSITESNATGFFSEVQGLNMYHFVCDGNQKLIESSPATSYLIEGKKIPDPKCRMTFYIQYRDSYCPYDNFKSITIRLLSVPEDLYLFEKSLYTHKKISGDPFAEPVYINGNIKGGNGIFALCRSKEIKILFSPWI